MTYFYISFAMPKKAGGFRGATVVEAENAESAVAVATLRGLNPGGEAAILEVPSQYENNQEFTSYRNRLVSKEEILGLGGKRLADLPQAMQDRFGVEVTLVCSCCNPPRRH